MIFGCNNMAIQDKIEDRIENKIVLNEKNFDDI